MSTTTTTMVPPSPITTDEDESTENTDSMEHTSQTLSIQLSIKIQAHPVRGLLTSLSALLLSYHTHQLRHLLQLMLQLDPQHRLQHLNSPHL